MLSLTSPVRSWHQRVAAGPKLAAVALFALAIFAEDRIGVLVAALLGVAALHLGGGRLLALAAIGHLRPLVPFLAVIGVYHLATGTALLGVAIALKLVAAFGLANLVTMTTRLDEIMALVERALAPLSRFGVNVGAVGLAVAMVIRFTPALGEKGARLIEAWRSRSTRRAGLAVVAPLMVLAIDDAEHVAEALKARGGVRSDDGR